MKKLFYSKTFRKNLSRWLTSYVLFMLLFTVVVTYSKYITSMSKPDSARVAKFNIVLENTPNNKKYLPNSNINYNFSVDTTNLEVATTMTVNIKVLDKLSINSLKVGSDELLLDSTSCFLNSNTICSVGSYEDINSGYTYKTIDLISTITPRDASKTNYELVTSYVNESLDSLTTDDPMISMNKAIIVGYSAKQID